MHPKMHNTEVPSHGQLQQRNKNYGVDPAQYLALSMMLTLPCRRLWHPSRSNFPWEISQQTPNRCPTTPNPNPLLLQQQWTDPTNQCKPEHHNPKSIQTHKQQLWSNQQNYPDHQQDTHPLLQFTHIKGHQDKNKDLNSPIQSPTQHSVWSTCKQSTSLPTNQHSSTPKTTRNLPPSQHHRQHHHSTIPSIPMQSSSPPTLPSVPCRQMFLAAWHSQPNQMDTHQTCT